MKLHYIALGFLVLTTLAYAQGRKPAVEDFVGIEVDESGLAPQGTEGLFNFEKEITTYAGADQPSTKGHWVSSPKSSASSYMGFAFLLGLPALSLFLVMNRFRQKAKLENASNIEVLEKYRREREEKKSKEEYKKAS
jgi:hypothetical protein